MRIPRFGRIDLPLLGTVENCPLVTNDRGRSSVEPCEDYCGPLDLSAWYEAASRELNAAQARRSAMLSAELIELDRLRNAYKALPSRVLWATIDRDATTRQAARIAQEARCVRWQTETRAQATPPTPPTPTIPTTPSAPDTGNGWTWPEVDVPNLPNLPAFNLGGTIPLLLLGALVLLALSPPGQAARRAAR